MITFKPKGYNEGSFVFKRQGKYYLMWSEFGTRDPKYRVNFATFNSPTGPFLNTENHPVLRGKGVVKDAGHHSVVKIPNNDEWYISYHRFKIPRETCIAPMRFDQEGNIMPVDVFEKVEPVKIKHQKQ